MSTEEPQPEETTEPTTETTETTTATEEPTVEAPVEEPTAEIPDDGEPHEGQIPASTIEPTPPPEPAPAPKLPDPVKVSFNYVPDGNNANLEALDDTINFMDTASITISHGNRKFTYRRNRID